MQRIGLSATQRPLEEVAHFLAGVEPSQSRKSDSDRDTLAEIEHEWTSDQEAIEKFRPVTIINASEPKRLELRVEVPVEDMARLGQIEELPSGAASQGS